MIICPNCSRENEDHYKFCLGCGTELTRLPRADAPTALPGHSPARAAVVSLRAPRSVDLIPPAVTVPSGPPAELERAASAPSAPPAPAPAPSAPPPPALAPTPAPPAVEPEPVAPPEPAGASAALVPEMAELPPEAIEPTMAVEAGPLHAALQAAGAPPDPADLPFELSLDASTDLAAAAAAVADVDLSLPLQAADRTDESPPITAESAAAQREAGPTLRDELTAEAVVEQLEQGIPVEPTASGSAPLSDPRLCGNCGAAVPEGFKFCGVCGTRYEARQRPAGQVFVPSVQDASQAPARLVVIHPDGTEGDVFPLGHGESTVGRSHPSSIFSEDPFLSPRHATFYFVKGQLFVRDEGSLNGVFVRIKAEVELFHGDMFRLGQQLLRFEEMAQVRPVLPGAGDGTTVMGSPLRGAWGRLASIVALSTPAAVWVLRRPEEHLGRERGEITFPDDGFVSGTHCKVSTRDGRFFLRDVDSTNGTYLRIKAEGILAQGDLILLGQQLFKIDLAH